MKEVYGYVRVSTKDQCEERQLIAMEEFGVPETNIFLDKLSGKDFERPRYKRLLRKLRPGDVVVVKSIDRLGRNYGEIQDQWRDPLLCGPGGAGEHPPAAGGGHRGGESPGRKVWPGEKSHPGPLLRLVGQVPAAGDHRPGGGPGAGGGSQHLPKMGRDGGKKFVKFLLVFRVDSRNRPALTYDRQYIAGRRSFSLYLVWKKLHNKSLSFYNIRLQRSMLWRTTGGRRPSLS